MNAAIAREEIERRLRELLAAQPEIQVDVAALHTGTPIESIGFDSLSILDFMYEMEEHFGVPLTVRELLEMETVGDLVANLERKLDAKTLDEGE